MSFSASASTRALLAAAALACAALPARAVLVGSPGALPAVTHTEDFESYDGLLTGGPLALSSQITFTGDAGSEIGAGVRDLGENGAWGVGNHFAAGGFVGELRFTFAGLASGAGAFVNHWADGVLPFAIVVTAYGDDNLIVESHTVTVATGWNSYNEGLFVGIARGESDIRSLSFKGVGIVVDDLAVSAVPEPGTLALWLASLGAVGWRCARRSFNEAG